MNLFFLCAFLPLVFIQAREDGSERVKFFREQIGSQSPSDVLRPGSIIWAQALFPINPSQIETPVFTRMVVNSLIGFWHTHAACHPTALSIFGTKDEIDENLCDEDSKALISSLLVLQIIQPDYPVEANSFKDLLLAFDLDLKSVSKNQHTVQGWANSQYPRIVKYTSTDGWNSLGNARRSTFIQRFADSTNYSPVNSPYESPKNLSFPLRWQPISFDADGHGKFFTPVHVTPHIGFTARPFLYSRREFMKKMVPSPYRNPNRPKHISFLDRKIANLFINKVLKISRSLDYRKRVLANWWDVKILSAGQVSLYYANLLKIDSFNFYRILMGEAMAEYDSILLAWKEKVRHDLIRPTTLIRRLRGGQFGETFVNSEMGVRRIPMSEWESIVKVMPHSEYPSGSMAICSSMMEHLQFALEEIAPNGTFPRFKFTIVQPLVPTMELRAPMQVSFNSLRDIAKSCGQSRLWAGVHFPPAISAADRLVKGLGMTAYYHMRNLTMGVVPENCAHS